MNTLVHCHLDSLSENAEQLTSGTRFQAGYTELVVYIVSGGSSEGYVNTYDLWELFGCDELTIDGILEELEALGLILFKHCKCGFSTRFALPIVDIDGSEQIVPGDYSAYFSA